MDFAGRSVILVRLNVNAKDVTVTSARTPVMMAAGKVGWGLIQNVLQLIAFLGDTAAALADAIRHPRKIRWRESFYYMDMCGSDALPIAVLICLAMGIIIGFQGAVQLHKYGQDIYLAKGVAISITVELGPLMCAVIAIGRAGSAFAAEIGTMKVSEEIDALTTMGLVPSRFLVIPKLIAMFFMMPILTMYGMAAGIFGGMIVAVTHLGTPALTYFQLSVDALVPSYIAQGLIKSIVFGMIITVVGCMCGFEAQSDAQGVGRAATRAVVTSIFLVIVADTILTILFNLLLPI